MLISALLVRNEAGEDRYLAQVLDRLGSFSDKLIVLDDRSTDATAAVCRKAGAVVHTRSIVDGPAWGNEAPARRQLWELAIEHCPSPNDWLLICDADMVLHGDPLPLLQSRAVNAWAWPLYDLWDSPTTYRSDQFWIGHTVPRVWLVAPRRVPAGWTAEWPGRGIHTGHIPANFPISAGLAPDDVYWLHYGWMKPEHREAKNRQYLSVRDQLTPHEQAHADSIRETP